MIKTAILIQFISGLITHPTFFSAEFIIPTFLLSVQYKWFTQCMTSGFLLVALRVLPVLDKVVGESMRLQVDRYRSVHCSRVVSDSLHLPWTRLRSCCLNALFFSMIHSQKLYSEYICHEFWTTDVRGRKCNCFVSFTFSQCRKQRFLLTMFPNYISTFV